MIFSEYVKTLENVQEAQVEFCRYYYPVHIPFEKVPFDVKQLKGPGGEVIRLPDKVGDSHGREARVTGIRAGVFRGNTEVTDIILPRDLYVIPEGALLNVGLRIPVPG